jgi:hypothetical protein
MEPMSYDGTELEINPQIEELEEKIAPMFFFDTVWPFPGPGGWGGR